VLGGSYVALEIAQMYSRLGSEVTLLQRSGQILSSEDADVAEELTRHLRAEGIEVRVGQKLERVERDGPGFIVHATEDAEPEPFAADAVVAALGRRANTDALDVHAAGVELDPDGFVRVGEDLRTTSPDVYAAGDVVGDPAFVYAAAYEGDLAAQNALSGDTTPRDYSAFPWVVFTDPQVAGVGLNEREAARLGIAVDVSVMPLSHVPRALAARDTRGFIKLLRAKGEDRLVGARIVAPEGGEQVMQASLMIRFGLPVSETRRHFHPYLTQGEGMKLAMIAFDKDVEALSCCAS
jgi:mercuric reductase